MALSRNITPPKAENTAEVKQATPQNDDLAENTQQEVTKEVSTSSASDTTATDARIISRPELVETLELQERAKAQGIELDSNTNPDGATSVEENSQTVQGLKSIWQKFLDLFASLSGTSWLLIAGILALPALLLGVFSLIRRTRKSEQSPLHDAPQTDRIDSDRQARRARHEEDAAGLFDDEELTTGHDDVTRIAGKTERRKRRRKRRPFTSRAEAAFDNGADEAKPNETSVSDATVAQAISDEQAWQSAFGNWLMQQPDSARLEACIEFLIYWIAYGDERYHPDLRKQLFTKANLDTHDHIKRWVLKQDIFAFADVVGWLRNHANEQQLQQCLGLVMALLVTEHSVTPVQNTMLRFLSDAFNIGKEQFEHQFEEAFGHPLPPIPRTDKTAWWAKQEAEAVQRWDARSMTTRSDTEQMMARLGLSAGYGDAQVIKAFRRAARRCHPDRFTELGERERALAEQQFIKFEQARDKLLGVTV